MPTIYIVRGIDSNGNVLYDSYTDSENEMNSMVRHLSSQTAVARVVIDIALPRKSS